MTEPSESAPNDLTPFAFTGIALAAALVLNLLTQNGLWFWYTVVGISVFLIVLGLTRSAAWRLPSRALWGIGITASLHYVGGSLSGLHQIGGPNGLYYAFPWWDNVVHFLGSISLAIGAYALLAPRLLGASRGVLILASIGIATTLGVLVELYEFAQYAYLGTVDQGYYTNNLLDLYYNLLGACTGAIAYARAEARPSVAPANATIAEAADPLI